MAGTRVTAEWEVAQAYVAVLDIALDNVEVSAGWPGDTVKDEAVWIDEIRTVEMGVPTAINGRHEYDVRFDIVWAVQVVGGALTHEQIMARLSHIEETMLSGLQDDSHITALNDDPDGNARQVNFARMTERRSTVMQMPNGGLGIGEVVTAMHCRVK